LSAEGDGERDANAPHEGSRRVRAFFALPLSREAIAACGRAREALRLRSERSPTAVRFLPDDALHVTLCFLGSVERSALPDFVRVLEASARVEPFSAGFSGLGAFSSAKRARVVVAELADGEGRLEALAELVSRGAEKLGVPLEERAFRPHVTLARLKRPSDVSDWLGPVSLEPVITSFGEVRLYESHLNPRGASYSVLARAEFERRRT
jgi:RNA 2',3'-cyclic 3'-phosphodiesterase